MLSLFVMFVVGAVLLGAGAMLAPAWRTAQPRIALSATLALALITGGAVWWAYTFGWDTLVIDYLLFALVSIVVLGGTLSQGQTRAEARGETLEDKDQGWPGPGDLLFFVGVGGLVAVLVSTMVLPQGITGVQIGYLTFLASQSSQFDTLAPHSTQAVFYAPGFIALTSYLSHQLAQPIAAVQFAVGGVVALLIVWLAYDWGGELGGRLLGRAFAVAALLTGGALLLLAGGQYTTLLATAFALAAAICALRLRRAAAGQDAVAGGLLLGAALYADLAIGGAALLVMGGYVVWHLARRQQWRALALLCGALLFGLGPWLLTLPGRGAPLLFSDPLTVAGWLILPATYAGGLLLHALARRAGPRVPPALHAQRYPALMAALLLLLVGGSAAGLRLRDALPITGADLAALLWLRDHAAPDTVVRNAAADDWAAVLCECRVTIPPLAVDMPPAAPAYAIVPERSSQPVEGSIAFEQGEAAVVRLP